MAGFGEREQLLGVEFCGLFGRLCGLRLRKGGLFCGELRRLFCGLGFFDFLDQLLLRSFFCVRQRHLFFAVSGGEGLGVFDLLLFDDHCFFQDDALFDHLLNIFALHFDGLLLLDRFQSGDTLALDDFQVTIPGDAFDFDGVGAFLVALGDEDLAIFVFVGDG